MRRQYSCMRGGDSELRNATPRGFHSQMELDGAGRSQSVPGALEFDLIGRTSVRAPGSLFGEVANRGRVVRVREVTRKAPSPTGDEPICKIDFSSMAPLHQTTTAISSSDHSSLPIPPPDFPHIVHQGTTGNMSAAMLRQIQPNNTSGMAGEAVQGAIASNYSNAPNCLLQGMAGYDVWSMLPGNLKGISRSCNTRPFEWRNPETMNSHPENDYNEGRSVAEFDYLNLVRAPSTVYEPIYQGTTLFADPHLKAYNARILHVNGTSGITTHSRDDQSSTSVLVHSSSIILPDYHVLKLRGSDEYGTTSMHG